MRLFPLLAVRPVRLRAPTVHVLILLSLIFLHVTLVICAPGQLALLIFANLSAAMLSLALR
jgi:hypothetical protein